MLVAFVARGAAKWTAVVPLLQQLLRLLPAPLTALLYQPMMALLPLLQHMLWLLPTPMTALL